MLAGSVTHVPPIWFMRQAGRYLPEYRDVRAKAGGFVELCLDPLLAAEVTVQPVKRFGLDAAILFSDILIVPHALGVPLWFEEGDGPQLEPVNDAMTFAKMRSELDEAIAEKVYEAVSRVRWSLPREVALIGFVGAPWTIATYLIAGRGADDQRAARELMRRDNTLFEKLIRLLAEGTAAHLIGQLRAGADVVQIFDTWAGVLDPAQFNRWCVEPTAWIVSMVRAAVPNARVIVFPRDVGLDEIARLVEACSADCVSLGGKVDRKIARTRLGGGCALQGNLGPETLLAGGAALDREIDQILEDFHGARHIFNLGHGILKETPIKHVERMVERVRRGA
ncbi:MAG TPA: uroporphyrinogen decarboxylase [Xanthobacteraceae bacterium]